MLQAHHKKQRPRAWKREGRAASIAGSVRCANDRIVRRLELR
jgi:hypothetical protein